MKKDHENEKLNKEKSYGNKTEGSKDYKDPVGSQDNLHTPKNSGYDEKQPR